MRHQRRNTGRAVWAIGLGILAALALSLGAPSAAQAQWQTKLKALTSPIFGGQAVTQQPAVAVKPAVAAPQKPARMSLEHMGTMQDLTAAVQDGRVGKGDARKLLDTLNGVQNFASSSNPFQGIPDARPIANIVGKGVKNVEVKTLRTSTLDAAREWTDKRDAVDLVAVTVTHPDGSKSMIDAFKLAKPDNPYGGCFVYAGRDSRDTYVVVSAAKRNGGQMSRTTFINGENTGTARGKSADLMQQRSTFFGE